jgi:uncharacterized membrane protein YsdA (DUF1294 family)
MTQQNRIKGRGKVFVFLILYLLVINLVGLLIMYVDKQRAIKGKYRIREAILWETAIMGGAIGTTIGMKWFRHKTKHLNFKFGFPILVIIEITLAHAVIC